MTAPRRSSLHLVEAFVERLRTAPPGDPSDALAVLVRELPATGACLAEWAADGRPVVLAVAGLIYDVTQLPGFEDLLRRVDLRASPGVMYATFPGVPPLCCAYLIGSQGRPLALAIFGEHVSESEHAALVRSLVGVLDRFMAPAATPHATPPPAEARLVFPDGYIPGDSQPMRDMYHQMEPLLQGDLPVLIAGETGVGKEAVARTLHASSRRRSGPFVAINCAAIPADLLEAELFGIGKGVATGVVERPGKFQLAQGGTLFLDEIGEMPLGLQAKLLRALQEKEVQPVGGPPVKIDLRVVSATNSDLRRRVEGGRFRSDLYYRVAGFVLEVPPLRQRPGHIPRLVEDFVRAFSAEAAKHIRGVSVEALRALVAYGWPGNVRELEHEVRRLVYVCPDGDAIGIEMLSPHVREPAAPCREDTALPVEGEASLRLDERLADLERQLISEALRREGGNRTRAAKLLGVSRNGLAEKMRRLGLAP